MTSVPPPNAALPQMFAATASAPVATIANPPPVLAAATPGTRLDAVVDGTGGNGTVVVATADGPLALRTSLSLPDGAAVTLDVVQATANQVTVRITSLDGQPPQQALARPSLPSSIAPDLPATSTPLATASLPTIALPIAPGTPAPLAPGEAWWPTGPQPAATLPTVSAVVIAAPPDISLPPTTSTAPVNPGGAAPLYPTGSALSVRIATVEIPETADAPQAPPAVTTTTPVSTAPSPGASQLATAQPDAAGRGSPDPARAGTIPSAALPAASPQTAPAAPVAPTQAVATTTLAPAPLPDPVDEEASDPAAALGAQAAPASAAAATDPLAPSAAPDASQPALSLPSRWPPSPPSPPLQVQQEPPVVLTGTVIDATDDVPVIGTPQGQIQLNVRANLPVGTVVTLVVDAHQLPAAAAATPRPTPAAAVPPLATPAAGWPTLSEALQVMQRTDPQAALELAAAIPDGGPRTALALMVLVQALRRAEPRQWPGDAVLRAIERAGPRGAHLAALLSDEVDELSRQSREPAPEWRTMPLPWHADGRVERIRLVLRETNPDEDKRGRDAGGTRFLVDLELSQLGPLQLDGMMRKETRSFDMILRTVAPLPSEMRRDLAGLFATTNAAMNLNGGLSFQVSRQFPDPAGTHGPSEKRGLWV